MLLFSEYDRTLKNISISQPMVDVDMEDTNSLIIRYPKFKRVTHLILSYDAQNLFLKQKNGFGYFMDLETTLQAQEDDTNNGYFVIGVTSNSSRKIQYNPYPRDGKTNYAIKHIDNIMNEFLPQIIGDYDIDYNEVKKIVLGSSMGGLMSFKTSILYPQFDNVISFSPAFWYGYPGIEEDLQERSEWIEKGSSPSSSSSPIDDVADSGDAAVDADTTKAADEEAERRKLWFGIPRRARVAIRRLHRNFKHLPKNALVQMLRAAKAFK